MSVETAQLNGQNDTNNQEPSTATSTNNDTVLPNGKDKLEENGQINSGV